MGCCGDKRRALSVSYSKPHTNGNDLGSQETVSPRKGTTHSDALFRYTGNGVLDVKVSFSKNTYHFTQSTRELAVSGEDVAMLRGYPELVEIKPN